MSIFFKKEQINYAKAVILFVFTQEEMIYLKCEEWLSNVIKEYCSSESDYRE